MCNFYTVLLQIHSGNCLQKIGILDLSLIKLLQNEQGCIFCLTVYNSKEHTDRSSPNLDLQVQNWEHGKRESGSNRDRLMRTEASSVCVFSRVTAGNYGPIRLVLLWKCRFILQRYTCNMTKPYCKEPV